MRHPAAFGAALLASFTMAFTTACASGGFKVTREYAGFVNRQPLILRIVIYLLTSVVFMVTLLIDLVLFNTMDFWQGKVAAGDYTFTRDAKTFYVKHEVLPGEGLKRSTINIHDASGKLVQNVVLRETTGGEVELHVDGVLRTKVRDIASLPMITSYDAKGHQTGDQLAMIGMSSFPLASAR